MFWRQRNILLLLYFLHAKYGCCKKVGSGSVSPPPLFNANPNIIMNNFTNINICLLLMLRFLQCEGYFPAPSSSGALTKEELLIGMPKSLQILQKKCYYFPCTIKTSLASHTRRRSNTVYRQDSHQKGIQLEVMDLIRKQTNILGIQQETAFLNCNQQERIICFKATNKKQHP